MFGPKLLAASLVPRSVGFKHGNSWQYHSRSDHHSKIACWGLMFDLLRECALLRTHVASGLVGYGLNHEMRDFRTARKKNLDLVICRPRSDGAYQQKETFLDQATSIGVVLDGPTSAELSRLPALQRMPVGAVHIALEAKACMTAFHKARPRLYDELNSSHAAIHGHSPHTLAAGLAMVNAAAEFISPGRNDFKLSRKAPIVSGHNQPHEAAAVIEKLREIPRRARDGEDGFDALGIIVVKCRNDGTPVELVQDFPAPQVGDIYHYEMAVHRLAQLYEQRFREIS
jgi:hypothetical protein